MDKKSYEVPAIYRTLQKHPSRKHLTVEVPGSKSITNRALLLATLAEGSSLLKNVLFSDDSRHFLQCIQNLGFETTVDEPGRLITVKGCGGRIPKKEASLYVGSAGTAARFLTACLGVSEGTYVMDASEQMRRRPMAPLLSSLAELGCHISYGLPGDSSAREGHFPFVLQSHGFSKDTIQINIDHSSQFLSALLICACLSEKDFTIQVEGSHGMAYIAMTCRMMEQFGVSVQQTGSRFLIKAGQRYQAMNYSVEPDVSAACYFYACVPLLGVPVLVRHVHADSMQGDIAFLNILEQMGCVMEDTSEGILLSPPAEGKDSFPTYGQFPGVTVDMSACSDQAITLAAIAPFASSPTTITGIGHIRFQESDRIHAIATELGKMGLVCEETQDSITIFPGTPKPCAVDTYDDHRMAMGFSLTGLRAEGIVINNPDCCRKTFENYFEVLEQAIDELFSCRDIPYDRREI